MLDVSKVLADRCPLLTLVRFSAGSGGVLALLLGRFGLTVQQAVACYKSLMFATPVFQQVPEVGTPTSQPRASTMLDHVIDMLLIMSGLPHSAPLLHDSPHGCHTAVVTMRSMHPSGVPSVFRSYAPAHSGQLHKVEIQKLIRLCLAEFIQEAPMDIEGITYLDGGLTTWNPANIANHEARFKLHEGRKVEVLLSIGSGVKQPIDMVQEISAGVWGYTGKRLHALATSAHDTHRTVEQYVHGFDLLLAVIVDRVFHCSLVHFTIRMASIIDWILLLSVIYPLTP